MDNLENWRQQIDTIDNKLLNLLARRMNLVEKIGKYKKENHLLTFDKTRWDIVLKSNLNKAKSLNLSKGFIKKLLTLIHKYSIEIQNEATRRGLGASGG